MNATAEDVKTETATTSGKLDGAWGVLLILLLALYLVGAATFAAIGAYSVWPNAAVLSAANEAAAKPAPQAPPQAAQAPPAEQAQQAAAAPAATTTAPATTTPAAEKACTVTACQSQLEKNLVRFVFYLGVLGACLHAMTSIASFAGNRAFKHSWFIWYLLRPLIGGVLAWIVFLVFRGGFLGVTEVNHLNPYAFGALAALSGLFSKRVIDKLSELVDTLFRMPPGGGDENRNDKLKQRKPLIKDVSPKEVRVAAQPVEISVTGENFSEQTIIKVGEHSLTPIFMAATLLKLAIPPEHLRGRATVSVVAMNGKDAATISNEFPLTVTA